MEKKSSGVANSPKNLPAFGSFSIVELLSPRRPSDWERIAQIYKVSEREQRIRDLEKLRASTEGIQQALKSLCGSISTLNAVARKDNRCVAGIWIRLTSFEQRAIDAFRKSDQVRLEAFVRAVWNEPYNRKKRRKYDTALSRLNNTLVGNEPTIHMSFHIRGDYVIREKH